MKMCNKLLVVLIWISLMLAGLSYAQPKIPKESIPSDIPSDVRKEIERLYSSDPKERASGAHSLMKMGSKAVPAVPFLIEILGDSTKFIAGYQSFPQKITRFGLSYESSPIWVPVGGIAVGALVEIGKPAVEPLIVALKDLESRKGIAKTEVRTDKSGALIVLATEDETTYTRINIIKALGGIKDSRAVESLITAFNDKLSDVREAVIRALGAIKDTRVIETLIIALKDEYSFVRGYVASALEEIGDMRAVEPLIAALSDKNWRVRSEAAVVLRKITGQYFGEDPLKWQEWWKKNKPK